METLTKASFSDQVSGRELRNLDLAYRAACESAVLLKNEGVLPFKGKRVAAFGPGVTRTIKGGTGSGEVNERHSVSILEGLEERGFEVMTRAWLEDYESCYQAASEKFQAAGKRHVLSVINRRTADFQLPPGRAVTREDIANSCTENCLYVLSRQAGEGGDRRLEKGDYLLSDEELRDITFCAKNYKYFVLIINCGSPVDLSPLEKVKGIGAILYISQPGTRGGTAVADLLSGAVVPSGKLADSWARRYGDLPFSGEYSYLNGNLEHEYYKEGLYVGYRFFDSFGVEPLYPFGFGLSYTKFRLNKPVLSLSGSRVLVRVKLRNTGRKYSGREVVQVYVSVPEGRLGKEFQRLAAFRKTELLAPGESQELELEFDLRQLTSYRFDDASSVLEAGDYVVRVGTSSRDTVVAGLLRLEREIIVSRHRHICPLRHPFLELPAPARRQETLPGRIPVLKVDPACIETRVYCYDTLEPRGDERVQAFAAALTPSQMVDLVVGSGVLGGERRFQVPGAAGHTSSALWENGLADVALCDGPAGLRLDRRSALSGDGKIRPLDKPSPAAALLPKALRREKPADPERERILYQFTTAFPVEAALAQSWDTELLYQIGQAVYEEMKEYGCTFWLAPAVNIHRNPLCGRNFEYFSEDPYLCGKLAAAITRGVQQEEGYYVTVKHFACNNQEDNRNHVSSDLTERTLREIYLPAFEIAVREGGAKSIMTSYNKVNGVYAPNSHDLCTKVLRCEWGFEGVVMTDWLSTLPAKNGAALAMKAGNDLIMPGEPVAKAQILLALKTGLIGEADLRRCCCNVIKAILDSAIQREYIG